MTARELDLQRSRVTASLHTDDLRETHRAVYPLRSSYADRDAVQTGRESGRAIGAGWKVRER